MPGIQITEEHLASPSGGPDESELSLQAPSPLRGNGQHVVIQAGGAGNRVNLGPKSTSSTTQLISENLMNKSQKAVILNVLLSDHPGQEMLILDHFQSPRYKKHVETLQARLHSKKQVSLTPSLPHYHAGANVARPTHEQGDTNLGPTSHNLKKKQDEAHEPECRHSPISL